MPVNLDKPQLWKSDICHSVDMYNTWFMQSAPEVFRETRRKVTKHVENTLALTRNLTEITPDVLREHPAVLPSLRMSTCPPIAVDRLIGLAGVSKNLVHSMEKGGLPAKTPLAPLRHDLHKISSLIRSLADRDVFHWLEARLTPTEQDIHRAASIVADRLTNANTNPIIRNAQEERQFSIISLWLEEQGYEKFSENTKYDAIPAGTYGFRVNFPVKLPDGKSAIQIPVDTAIMPKSAKIGDLPILIEAKSAGDFTNTNKRRKEEAQKVNQLRRTYGNHVRFILFLCGYFDVGYLGYEAAEGIDWVWEHRIQDLAAFGI